MNFVKINSKLIIFILLTALVLTIIVYMQGRNYEGIYTEGRQAKFIDYPKDGKRRTIDLELKGTKDNITQWRKVKISLGEGKRSGKPDKKNEGDVLRENMGKVAGNIGNKEDLIEGKIKLPEKLEDGTELSWNIIQDRSYTVILPLAIFMIYLMYKSEGRKNIRIKNKINEDITRDLPGYTGQLLLMISSGVTLQDGMVRIAEEYRSNNYNDYFHNTVISGYDEAKNTGLSYMEVLKRKVNDIGNRDFIRLMYILSDSRNKGIDIRDKLRREADVLWTDRKRKAEYLGKLAETKLAIPLGILLLSLVIITAAPAFMQVQAGV